MGKKVSVILAVMLLALAACGCATGPKRANYLHLPFKQARVHVEPVLTFEVTAADFVEVKEVKIHVDCEQPEKSKGFLLCCRLGSQYLPEMASGFPGSDGTVSFAWVIVDGLVIEPEETVTFEVISIDRAYNGAVSLVSNGLDRDGSDLINPPEEG